MGSLAINSSTTVEMKLLQALRTNSDAFADMISDISDEIAANRKQADTVRQKIKILQFNQRQISKPDSTDSADNVTDIVSFNGNPFPSQKLFGTFTDAQSYYYVGTKRVDTQLGGATLYEYAQFSGVQGSRTVTDGNGPITSQEAYKFYDNEISNLQAQVQSLSSISQQLQLKINQVFNKYNEAYSLQSQIVKDVHDTNSAVIRNV